MAQRIKKSTPNNCRERNIITLTGTIVYHWTIKIFSLFQEKEKKSKDKDKDSRERSGERERHPRPSK